MHILKNIASRLREPSTYAGLAALAYGLEDLNVINEADIISDTTIQLATQVEQGNWIGATLAAVFGIIAIFKSEKSKK